MAPGPPNIACNVSSAARLRKERGLYRLANPSRIPRLFRDGRNNDRPDARKLAHLNQLPAVHPPAADISAWRTLINHCRTLIQRRTRTKNQIRSIPRTFAYSCPHGICWSRAGQVWLRSLTCDEARDLMMQTLHDELTFLDQNLTRVERHLDTVSATRPRAALLQTIPGIGPRTAEPVTGMSSGRVEETGCSGRSPINGLIVIDRLIRMGLPRNNLMCRGRRSG